MGAGFGLLLFIVMLKGRSDQLHRWMRKFALLETYHKREGHCNVPQSHEEGGENLGLWVINQRRRKDCLFCDQVRELEKLGFEWNTLDAQCERNFAPLEVKQKEKESQRKAHEVELPATQPQDPSYQTTRRSESERDGNASNMVRLRVQFDEPEPNLPGAPPTGAAADADASDDNEELGLHLSVVEDPAVVSAVDITLCCR